MLPAQWQGHGLTTPLGALNIPAEAELLAPQQTLTDLEVLVSPQGIELTPDDTAEALGDRS